MTASLLVIPVFIPHSGCPYHCAFCDQAAITNESCVLPDGARVSEIIGRYLRYAGPRPRVEVAFFGGNFLGMGPRQITDLLDSVRPFIESGVVHGIRFSTRPDTVTRDRLDLLHPYPVRLVELGVQTLEDPVLERVNRGHTREDSLRALTLLRETGLKAGVQVMAGLPGDTREGVVRTAQTLCAMKPVTARIYPVLVLENTRLARWYKKGLYRPLDLDAAVDQTCEAYRIFNRAGVAVIRMGLMTSQMDDGAVLAGPRHPAFGHLVLCRSMYLTVLEKIQALAGSIPVADRARAGPVAGTIVLQVHPFDESRLRGDRNSNLARLETAFPGCVFEVQTDPVLALDQVHVIRCPA
jgi:histone acetyltransferase (RNA polymerase elongator complex component)